MKNILFFVILSALFAGIILISTKSRLGSPEIGELNTLVWTENGPLELSPERARFALLYSLVEDKSFQLSNEVARLATPDLGYKDGHYVSLFAPGTSLAMVPGYLVGKQFGASHLGASLTIGIFAFLNAWLIIHIVASLSARPVAGVISALIFLVGTPAFTYAGVIYQHHLSTFFLLFVIALALGKKKIWKIALSYFLFGTSIIIDYPNAFLILPVILYSTYRFISKSHKNNLTEISFPSVLVASMFTILIPLLIYLRLNHLSYGNAFQLSNTVTHIQALDEDGRPSAGRGADERASSDIENLGARKRNALNFFKARHLVTGLYAFSVSPDRGLLVFSPVIVLGFLGFGILLRKNAHFAQTLLAVVVLNILLYAMRSDPWGGWAFGPRYLIPSMSVLALALGVLIAKYNRHLLLLSFVLLTGGYSVIVNASGAISTTANPPQIEVLSLEALSGRQERYSYDRNLEYLKTGKSKSFIYKNYFSALSPWQYYLSVVSTLSAILLILIILNFRKKS